MTIIVMLVVTGFITKMRAILVFLKPHTLLVQKPYLNMKIFLLDLKFQIIPHMRNSGTIFNLMPNILNFINILNLIRLLKVVKEKIMAFGK